MRYKAMALMVLLLFCLAQLVVLADKPVGHDKTFCAGNSHVCFEDGVKIKDPERFPGNGAPEDDREPPGHGEHGIIGQAGRSNNAFMELVSKDPESWEIRIGEGWGKLRYGLEAPEFAYHFSGQLLTPGTEYALIIYTDPWPGTGSVLLTSGYADEYGSLLLKGSMDLGADLNDAKVWLVYADDFDGEAMTGWNPEGYLFEYDLISYTDTDA
ncbi:MAG: hypothetical protein ACOX2R_02360 [Anaerolineae bacterium]|jgi:hypothetical protein